MSLNPFAQQFNKPPQQIAQRPPTQEQPQTTSQSPLNVIRTFISHANQPWRNILSHAQYAEITPYGIIYYVPVPGVGIVGINDTGLITSVNGMPIATGPGSNYAYVLNALMSAYGSPTPPVPAQPSAPPRPQPTQPTQAPPRPTAPIEALPATPTSSPPPTTQQQPPRFIEELLATHPPTAPLPPPSIEVALPMLTPPRRAAGLSLW
jgi:hypothetical protein